MERERKRGEKGVRHVGCMAAQAALLYQEPPVGVFLPNSAEKPKAMPSSTSANRAAITSLIDVFFYFDSLCLRVTILEDRASLKWRRGCWLFLLIHHSDLIPFLSLPNSLCSVPTNCWRPTIPLLQLHLHNILPEGAH